MSIWIDLLFMHGHFATPRLLEELLVPAAVPAVSSDGGGPGDSPPRQNAAEEDSLSPWDRYVQHLEADASFPSVVQHPFRAVGQLS